MRLDLRLGAGALLLAASLAAALGCAKPRHLDVLFISLDTVRRDHLSAYGYDRDTSPTLDRLARRAVVFEQAFAASTQTSPSHGSFLTGLDPQRHGSEINGVPIRQDVTTAAELFALAGFETAAFVSGYPLRDHDSGLGRGFSQYDDRFDGERRGGRQTVARALAWLANRPTDRPYFLFLHLYDAHGPYVPPPDYQVRYSAEGPPRPAQRLPKYQVVLDADGLPQFDLNDYVARYDTMIRFQDDLLSSLLAQIDLEQTAVVVVADHGETLDERFHVLDHGGQVFDEQIRIPLLVATPGVEAHREEAMVAGVDIMPTLLELGGVTIPRDLADRLAGRSLVPALAGTRHAGAPFVASTAYPFQIRHADRGYVLAKDRPILSIRSRKWKLIAYPGAEGPYLELYDLEGDPGETRNLSAAEPEQAERMRQALDAWYGIRGGLAAPGELNPETREKLESLGYVGG